MSDHVIMYVVPLCPHCARARRFLSGKGIPFEERNILTNAAYRREMRALTDALTVPITVIGTQVLIGFDAGNYQTALEQLPDA